MRIIKFNESTKLDEISIFLLDLKDEGFEINSEYVEGILIISGRLTGKTDRVDFIENILTLIKRIESEGYKLVNEKLHIYMGDVDGTSRCSFKIRFEEVDVIANKDVNSFNEFKTYLESVLDIELYEFDTEAYIPNYSSNPSLLLDISKDSNKFSLAFHKGKITDIDTKYQDEVSKVVLSNDEWAALNLWSIPNDQKHLYSDEVIIKSAQSKVFGFNRKGIEAVETCVGAFS